MKHALDLDPAHEKANDLIERIESWGSWLDNPIEVVDLSGDQPVYLILTHTQGPTPTSTETPPLTSTRTKLVKTSTPTHEITIEPTETTSATPAPEATLPPEPTDKTIPVSTEAITVTPRDVNTAYIHFGAVLVLLLGVLISIRSKYD